MFVSVWRYRVSEENDGVFRAAYGPGGSWAELFGQGEGYQGTELIPTSDLGHYITIDRWKSRRHFENFLAASRQDYEALDRECAAYTLEEELIGSGPTVRL